MLIHICFPLSDLLDSVWQTLGPSISTNLALGLQPTTLQLLPREVYLTLVFSKMRITIFLHFAALSSLMFRGSL